MVEWVESLPDGWTIYLWLVIAAMILIAAGFMLRWAAKNEQFDEDIKYVIFDADDQEKMEPDEYKKHQDVMKEQMKSREKYLANKKQQQKK